MIGGTSAHIECQNLTLVLLSHVIHQLSRCHINEELARAQKLKTLLFCVFLLLEEVFDIEL